MTELSSNSISIQYRKLSLSKPIQFSKGYRKLLTNTPVLDPSSQARYIPMITKVESFKLPHWHKTSTPTLHISELELQITYYDII